MAVNALLVRWMDGWREVLRQSSIDVIGRREAFLSMGAVQTTEEVDRVANMQLDVVANPRTAIATDLAPMGQPDRPYRAFNVGDTITVPDYGTGTSSQRVRALTGAEDDYGEITYSPELGDLILEEQERTLQAVKKMSDGTLEGDSPVAQPRLRAQVQRIWAPPSMPSTSGLSVVSTRPNGGEPSSQVQRTINGGDETFTLVTFRATPTVDGPNDGLPGDIYLWQHVPGGDGNYQVGHVQLPQGHDGGQVYTGTFSDSTIEFGGERGMSFRASGDFYGPVLVEAIFDAAGGTHTLAWDSA